jgi:NADPH:quinone reductase-like Zn-dependent oxidoreductase
MRAWKITKEFGLGHLSLVDADNPSLKPNEVRVKVRACSLNFRDLMVAKGIYNPRQSLPLIPLSDGAGDVIEVGPLVSSLKVGDRVCATFSQKWCHGIASAESMKATLGSPLDGMLTETKVLAEEGLIKFPDYLNYEEAATLPCAAVTAFNAIALQSSLKPSDTVLIEGTGGVSLFALQFAKAFGIKAILTSSSSEKLAKAKDIADFHGINYKENDNWPAAVLEMTEGVGVDSVVDVGGAKTIRKAIASLKKGGVVCCIGVLSGSEEPMDLRPILMNNIRIQGIFVGAKTVFLAMNRVLTHRKIHPVIDRIFDFSQAGDAFAYMERAEHFGKICIRIS